MASILLTFGVFSMDSLHIDFHWCSPSLTFQLWIHFIFLLTLPDSPNDQDPSMDCQWWWGRTWLWPGRWKPSLAHQLPHQPGAGGERLHLPDRSSYLKPSSSKNQNLNSQTTQQKVKLTFKTTPFYRLLIRGYLPNSTGSSTVACG